MSRTISSGGEIQDERGNKVSARENFEGRKE